MFSKSNKREHFSHSLTDSYTSRSKSTAISKYSILVQSNVAQITKLLNFVT